MSELNSKDVLLAGLQKDSTANKRAALQNPELFGWLLTQFNQTLRLATGKPTDMVIAVANKSLSTGKLAAKSSQSSGLAISLTTAQIMVTSASLVTVAGKGPGGALVAIGATFAKKSSLALNLAGGEDKRAKCMAAVADLAASGLTTTGLLIATPLPAVGLVTGAMRAGSIAQILLSIYQVEQACKVK